MKRFLHAILAPARWILGGLYGLLRGFLRALKPAGKADVKRRLATVVALLIIAAIGGLLVVVVGIMPIKASSGHWPITEWFLNFSMERSVATHSVDIKVPPLDDPNLALRGAAHYDSGCFPCHGAPHLEHPRIAGALTPTPPYLPTVLQQWEPEELFYIVKHGVKFTGMPAWPTQKRDDEVWAMVAFLQRFPEMDRRDYDRWTHGDGSFEEQPAALEELTESAAAPRAIQASCARCHGVRGHARGSGAFPKLAGQTPAYLKSSLQAYLVGQRHSGIMQPVAAGLSPREIEQIAQYYSAIPPAAASERDAAPSADPEAIERGESIARHGIAKQRVPGCADCHDPDKEHRNPHYPILDGQFADYLTLQLELFAKRHRGGTEYAKLMHSVADD